MKYFSIILLVLGIFSIEINAQQFIWNGFTYKSGDILFQDTDCGKLCDAIKRVTKSATGKEFSHIGLVYVTSDSAYVIEAIGANVHLTMLEKFVGRNRDTKGNYKIAVGRLKPRYQKLVEPALQFSVKQLGAPYDEVFLIKNGKYYCSELIYDAFLFANDNQPFFELQPMTFKDPDTGKTFDIWEKYYRNLGIPIPEGEPGCNPSGLSYSNKLDIIKIFY